MMLSTIDINRGFNEESFKCGLDNIVEYAYEYLSKEKDFINNEKKLEGICNYYLDRLFDNLSKKFVENNFELEIEDATNIYETYLVLSKEEKDDVIKIINVKFSNKDSIIQYIKKEPLKFLSATINSVGNSSYMSAFSILFRNLNILNSNLLIQSFNSTSSLISWIISPLMLLMIPSLIKELSQQKQELIPLFIMQVLINPSTIENATNIDDLLDNMQKLWNENYNLYKNMVAENKIKSNILRIRKAEENDLKNTYDKLLLNQNKLIGDLNRYKERFSEIVLSSPKINQLYSYDKYITLYNHKEEYENKNKKIKKQLGVLKSLINTDRWKSEIDIVKINFEISKIEKVLIEEAKNDINFIVERQPIKEFESRLKEINNLISKTSYELDEKINEIEILEDELKIINLEINKVTEIYPDVKYSV